MPEVKILSALSSVGGIPRLQDIIREQEEMERESDCRQMPSLLPIRVAVQVAESPRAKEEDRQAEARQSPSSEHRAVPGVAPLPGPQHITEERQRPEVI